MSLGRLAADFHHCIFGPIFSPESSLQKFASHFCNTNKIYGFLELLMYAIGRKIIWSIWNICPFLATCWNLAAIRTGRFSQIGILIYMKYQRCLSFIIAKKATYLQGHMYLSGSVYATVFMRA